VKLGPVEEAVWKSVSEILAQEPVASVDHVERMAAWCEKLGRPLGADLETLIAGALVHDTGVTIDRKTHYTAGRGRAKDILLEAGFPAEKVDAALQVMEAHSRYGGPEPSSLEAKVGQDADALEYIGAIGIVRAVVRGLTDGSYSGRASEFPAFLTSILGKVEGTFHTEQAERLGTERIAYMKSFLERITKELDFEA
jgi:uncharacterized protein